MNDNLVEYVWFANCAEPSLGIDTCDSCFSNPTMSETAEIVKLDAVTDEQELNKDIQLMDSRKRVLQYVQ